MLFGFPKPCPNKDLQHDFIWLSSDSGALIYALFHKNYYPFQSHETLSPGWEAANSKHHPFHGRLSSIAFPAPLFIQQQSIAPSPTHHFAVGGLEDVQLTSEVRLVLITCTAIALACLKCWPGLYYMRFSACVKTGRRFTPQRSPKPSTRQEITGVHQGKADGTV